jgi:hypothetical protein
VSRPLQFPSRAGRLLLLLVALTLGPFLLAALAGGWLVLTLSPLQKFYLPAYVASSFGAGLPHNLTSLRWVEKTARGRKPEPMMPEDAASVLAQLKQVKPDGSVSSIKRSLVPDYSTAYGPAQTP